MKNLILEEIVAETINNLPKNNISVKGIIEYIDYYKKGKI
jgi:hypothetical protein